MGSGFVLNQRSWLPIAKAIEVEFDVIRLKD